VSKASWHFWTLPFVAFVVLILSASTAHAADDSFIKLTSPNGGEVFQGGNDYQITWEQQGIDSVSLYWSPEPYVASYITSNLKVDPEATTGSFTWHIPSEFNLFEKYPQFKINAIAYKIGTRSVTDESDNYFTINPAPDLDEKTFTTIDLLTPNGGETFYDNEKIQIKVDQKNVKNVYVDLWADNFSMGSKSYQTDPSTTTGTYEYQLSQGRCVMPDVKVKIKISGESSHYRAPSARDESADYITIKSSPDLPIKPTLQLLTPNNNSETFRPGDTITVSWLQNDISNVTAYLLQDSITNRPSFRISDGIRIDPFPAIDNRTSFQWKIPDTISYGNYRIWIGGMAYNCSYGRYASTDLSDNYFTIEQKKEEPIVVVPLTQPTTSTIIEPIVEPINTSTVKTDSPALVEEISVVSPKVKIKVKMRSTTYTTHKKATIQNKEIALNGDLIVKGSLTLKNVILKINSKKGRQFKIDVKEGGELKIINSTISATNDQFSYKIYYRKGSKGIINGSIIDGSKRGQGSVEGLNILTDGFVLKQSTIKNIKE